MSLAVLVDVGVVTVDVDSILGVLTVVAMTVSADQRLVAVAGSLPLVKTLGAPVGVRVARSVLVVPIAASRVVGKGGGIAGLSLPLVETLRGPVSVGVTRSILVVSIAASGVVGKGRGIAGLSLPLVVPEAVPVVDVTVLGLVGTGKAGTKKTSTDKSESSKLGRPLVDTKTLGAPVSVGIARSVLVVSITTSGVVSKGGAVRGLGFPLVVAVAANGVAVAVVLRGVAVAVTSVVASDGTGRETEDNKLQQKLS